jgi:hypothetical protein
VGQLIGHVFPGVGIRWWGFYGRYNGPIFRQLLIQCEERLFVRREIVFCINGVYGAFWDAQVAINALLRVNDQHIGPFVKTVHGADLYAVGVFASDTVIDNNKGHGKLLVLRLLARGIIV